MELDDDFEELEEPEEFLDDDVLLFFLLTADATVFIKPKSDIILSQNPSHQNLKDIKLLT